LRPPISLRQPITPRERSALLAKKAGRYAGVGTGNRAPSLLYPELIATGFDTIDAAPRTTALEQMNGAIAKLDLERSKIEIRVMSGVPDQILTGVAREENARMIVMVGNDLRI